MCLRVGQKDVNCICRGYFYQPVVSEKLKDTYMDDNTRTWINSYKGKAIALPESFKPSKILLEYHNDVIFLR